MNSPRVVRFLGAALLLLALALPARSQEARPPAPHKKPHGSWLLSRPSDQDVILYISSAQWGTPDRWSFTSLYAHMFEKQEDRNTRLWLNSLTITLSPGTAGGRFGVGYGGIFTPKHGADLAILSGARVVLLRTWGNPLATGADRTFVGTEIGGSLSFLINLGAGHYWQISATDGRRESFWGFHVGVGI
jgi:hypothetical protein